MPEVDDEPWRAGGSWAPPERRTRWPPLVAAMIPCGAGAFVLGHQVRTLAFPLEIPAFMLVVIACAAPIIATRFAGRLAARFDEGVAAPPHALRERCIALALGAVAIAYVAPVAIALSLGAIGYEIVALRGALIAERVSRPLR